MQLFLHTSEKQTPLKRHYKEAFQEAIELYVVSAYLTEWDTTLTISSSCEHFRFIVGKDFGITRKDACRKVLKWLPADRKADFLVADRIFGFHPKSVIWRNTNGEAFAIIGSSNLSRAAFEKNVEANILVKLSEKEFNDIKDWIGWIEDHSIPVCDGWLDLYVEAERTLSHNSGNKHNKDKKEELPTVIFKIPEPANTASLLQQRRAQLKAHEAQRKGLMQLFRRVASQKITDREFYESLPNHWDFALGNRLQGKGWERLGKFANFSELAVAFFTIVDAQKRDRDDVVRREMDRLHTRRNPARKAFFSEMLCLHFPDEYPVLNKPVHEFLADHQLTAPRGASEGAKYIDLSKKLRMALRANPDRKVKNLAEFDHLIWASSS